MSNQGSIPIDENCLHAIVVKNGDQNKIIETLQITEPQVVTWDEAIKTTWDESNEFLNYENAIVSEDINGINSRRKRIRKGE